VNGTGKVKTDVPADLPVTAADLKLFDGAHEDLQLVLLTLYLLLTSAASGQKNGQSDQKRNVKKRRSKYGKNRNGFSSLKENWTGSTGSSG